MRRRLDVELARRGLVASRTEARDAIREGRVTVGGAPARVPARQVAPGEAVALLPGGRRYVSRGGEKLAGALDAFALDPGGLRVLDVGASTGGFTDCLLQRGARHVVAVDVGRNQLAWSLRADERVTALERTDVRALDPRAVGAPFPLVVVDVAFVSLRRVADALVALGDRGSTYVLLVKPQFEAGRDRVGRGGVVRDPEVHRAVLDEVVDGLAATGLVVESVVPSPLRGADGNLELFGRARIGGRVVEPDARRAAVEAGWAGEPAP